MRRVLPGLFLIACAGCDPGPVLHRGPVRAVSDERVCTYTYDAMDRPIGVAVDGAPRVAYTWNGDILERIEVDNAAGPIVWSNDATGSTITYGDTVITLSARVALPNVLACDPLISARVHMGYVEPVAIPGQSEIGVPDQYLTEPYPGGIWTYTYSGVDFGEVGMRWRDSWYTDELGNPLSTIFKYDQLARLIGEDWVRATSEESYARTYEYRDDGRVSQHAYHYLGDISDFYDYTYDEAGNLIEIKKTDTGSNPPPKFETYEYE